MKCQVYQLDVIFDTTLGKTFLQKIDSTRNWEGKRCPTSRPEIWGDDKYHDILHLGMMAVLFRYELKSHKDWYVKLSQG